MTDIKYKFTFLLLILIQFNIGTSCKRKDFLMKIEFGLADTLIKKEIQNLANDGEILIEIKDGDTVHYRNIYVDDKIYKAKIYFNDDLLKTGPLRTYDYSFTTVPLSESGNDTITKNGIKLNNWTIFMVSDFEKLKTFLDKKYGIGIFSNENNSFGEDTTYKYVSKEADLFLTHGKREDGKIIGLPIKKPFYTLAYLKVKSKNYETVFNIERKRRKKYLKPNEVLFINFESPKLSYDESIISENSRFELESKKEQIITISATSEIYSTYVIDDDISECKGNLSILDAYDDTLTKVELVYKFKTPLRSPINQQWRFINYNTYKLNLNTFLMEKIKRLIEEGNTLKTKFVPTAIVLENGNIIK